MERTWNIAGYLDCTVFPAGTGAGDQWLEDDRKAWGTGADDAGGILPFGGIVHL